MSFVDPDHIPLTGNAAIDSHHRRIGQRVNLLFDAWKGSSTQAELNDLLTNIMEEIEDHFAAERSLIRGAGYAGWDDHGAIHDSMRRRMADIRAQAADPRHHTDGMIEAFRYFEDLVFKHEFFDDQDFWETFQRLPHLEGDRLITWDSTLELGKPEIDREHLRLVDLLNDLYRSIMKPEGSETIAERIKALRVATRAHFEHEENAMRAVGHHDLKDHTVLHRVMLRDLDEASTLCQEGRLQDLENLVASGLRYWFLDHVAFWDSRI